MDTLEVNNNKIYIISFFGMINEAIFRENIGSYYPHKKVSQNIILIHTNDNPRVIYDKIMNKAAGHVMIVEIIHWWASVPQDVFDWIKAWGITVIDG